ncbi:MAG: tRNA guanosine(34) transglycosylase Tgt [Proteobacteria bacterium]|nr:tRNA guanosine(34) transglycosylase Tgt [Pseudomonadota bacterium]
MSRLQFEIEARDGAARAARVTLPRGGFDTPVFMPVGTLATVKALEVGELEALGVRVVLGNAYHLALRPGTDVVQHCGGLHRFMGWPHLLLTDSGGFQVFSLRALMRIDDAGVAYRSHIDGSPHFLDPETSMAVQAALGADIAMAFDHCPPADAAPAAIEEAMERTTRWARRCLAVERPPHQVRFGIVQGGTDLTLRRRHLEAIAALPFEGFALGGLSVGEANERMHEVVAEVAPRLPEGAPRYLMGVGRPEDLVRAIGAGVDMFDCVMPTRNARNGQLFTAEGRIVISNARHRLEDRPIDEGCGCKVCARYSRAYLRHLYVARELLYSRLATLHNVHVVVELVRQARAAIRCGRYAAFAAEFFARRAAADRG